MREVLSAPSCSRWFEVEDHGEVQVVKFTPPPRWDEDTIQMTGHHLVELLGQEGPRTYVLNLGAITIQASLMLAKLIAFHKKVHAAGGRVVLCAIDPDLHRVFERTKLSRLFPIFSSEQEALEAL